MANSPVLLTKQADDQPNHDTAATRHLCAGVYLDRSFRDLVLRRVNNEPRRRVAPSYGFDLVPVVEHAWRSWVLDSAQQTLILGILLVGWTANATAAVTALSCLGLMYCARIALRAAPVVIRLQARGMIDRFLRRTPGWRDTGHLVRQVWLLRASTRGCLVLLAAPVLTAGWQRSQLTEAAQAGLRLLVLLGIAAVAAGVVRQCSLNRLRHTSTLRAGRLPCRQNVIDTQQSHTYVVYRRPEPVDRDPAEVKIFDPYEPEPTIFVGSGQLVHRWLPPLGIQLLRPGTEDMAEREYAVPPFRTHELVDHLRIAMGPVGSPGDPHRLRGFQVRHRVFLDEREVPDERAFLRDKPGPAELRTIINDPHRTAQHFLEIRVSTCGEVVTTVFLRVTMRGRSLSLDFAACALTRTPTEYQVLDLFAESGKGAVVRSALRGLLLLPEEVGRVWRLWEAPMTLGRAIWARKDRTTTPRRGTAIGTPLSIREEKSIPWKHARFDETGMHDEIKLVEQRLLQAAEDFLKSRNVDTSAFKKKADNLINNSGVLNMGGKLELKQSAVGANAQVQMVPQGSAQHSGGDAS